MRAQSCPATRCCRAEPSAVRPSRRPHCTGRAVVWLVDCNLPALCEDKVDELWYAAEAGDLRPTGLLQGTARQTSRTLRGPLAGAVVVGITIEPAGGSQQPTTDPFAIIPITT
ncbi:anti-sigma factor [Streptomyces sp. NPDC001046]|uniref:anti-sigma factor n=1 Tax=Streptomyces sp. NPDC001046 TaxID=3364543 RepID=UPI0036C32FB2